MGQYYMIANLDKKEYLHPHKMGSGLKLLEIACCDLPRALILLLQDSDGRGGGDGNIDDDVVSEFCGRWAGDRIAIVGDYDSKETYNFCHDTYEDEEGNEIKSDWVDISFPARFAYEKWIDIEELRLGRTWGYEEDWGEFLKSKGASHKTTEKREVGTMRPDMVVTL